MSAAALEQGRTKRTHGAEPERTCVVSRAVLTPDELIRFVRSPDGVVVPDLAGRLPGRGVWVTCEKSFVAKAAERNAFAKSLKSPVKVPPDLADMVETLLKARALSALSFANKAGQVLCGFTKVEISIAKGEAFALLHGSDAAIDGRNKLDRKYKAVHAEMGAKHRIESDNTLKTVIFQLIIKHIGHIDQHEAHELAEIVAAKATDFQAEACELQHLIADALAEARWGHGLEGF